MIEAEGLSKVYKGRDGEVRALDDVSLAVPRGEFLVVRGRSGSGKSTLLLSLGGMVRPTSGKVQVEGKDLYGLPSQARARFRAENVGFVFQMFHLVPYLTVLENVVIPGALAGHKGDRDRAAELLERFDMSERINHKPSQLSTGERQRTAVARALLNEPSLLLADEPTGNLDPANGAAIIGYLSDFRNQGGTVIVVTHEAGVAEHADRVVHLERGRLVDGGAE